MKNYILPFCIISIVVMSSCTSSQIASSWRDPEKTVTISKLNKVLVVALLKDETSRHIAEDQMASYLNGKGVVSYQYLEPNFNKRDESAINKIISADGFDGAVTMRLVDVDKEEKYTPGDMSSYPTYYRSFSGYLYRSWNYYSTPGYYSTTKTYTIETNVYSIQSDKIIWTALTKTTDPTGVEKMTSEIADIIYKKMLKEGFITK